MPARRKPMKRGTLKQHWPGNREKVAQPAKPRLPIRKVSTARAKEMRLYYAEAKIFLNEPQHRACGICLCLGNTPMASTEVHHARGRIGKLLRDQRFWVPSCRSCREIPHQRPKWAREVGILSSAADWNTSPSGKTEGRKKVKIPQNNPLTG